MNFDELETVWRGGDDGRSAEEAQAIESARARAEQIDRAVRRRDWLETLIALAMAPLFGWMALNSASWTSTLGAWIVTAACLLIPVRLRLARRATPDRGLPVARAVEAELAAIRAQQRLLGSVAWWYLTPLGAGVILFFSGAPVSTWTKVAYAAAVVGIYVWMLRLNLHAVRAKLDPVARELEHWLASFREPHENGASNVS